MVVEAAVVVAVVLAPVPVEERTPVAVVTLLNFVLVMVEFATTRLTLLVVMLDAVVLVKLDTLLVLVVAAVGEVTTTMDEGSMLMLDAVTVVAPSTTQGTVSM